MSNCFCAVSSANTGKSGKEFKFKNIAYIFAVQLFANDGTRNAVLSTDTVDDAYILDKVNQSDASKRWYPLGQFKNGELPLPDFITQSLSDGATINVDINPQTFTGELYTPTPRQLGNIGALACNKIGIIAVDTCGALLIEANSDETEGYPIAINTDAWGSRYQFATATEASRGVITWEIDKLSQPRAYRFIDAELDLQGLAFNGVLDAFVSNVTGATTTEFVFDLGFKTGLFADQHELEGFVVADVELVNATANTVVTPSALTADAVIAGRYTVTYAAQTPADVVYLRSANTAGVLTKQGFEIAREDVTIP